MADFTSSLYLGMRHASAELPGWSALTTEVLTGAGSALAVDAAVYPVASVAHRRSLAATWYRAETEVRRDS